MKTCMLTTMDNKYNPFTEFDKWFDYDANEKHYNTCSLLAFFSRNSEELDDESYNEELDNAMAKVLALNPYGLHMIVYEDEADVLIPLANQAYEDMKDVESS